MDMKTPRVNAARLGSYIGKTVRVVAKVIKLKGDTAVVQLADGGQVDIKLSQSSNMQDQYVEIIGVVQEDKSIKMLTALNIGGNIDMDVVNHTIELMHTPAMAPYWSTNP